MVLRNGSIGKRAGGHSLALTAAISAIVGLAWASQSFGQVVIGDFEDSSLDAWGTDGGPGSPTLSQVTSPGVTLHDHALKAVTAQGGFWGVSTGNLITDHRNDLINATSFSYDLTLIGTELSGDGSAFAGFAQANEMAVTLFAPDGPDADTNPDLNIFAQRNAFGALTDSKGHAGQWAGDDGTRTLTWDLTKVTAVDPADGLTKPVGQILANHPDIVDAKIAFVEQMGGGVAPGAFYYDNVVLNGVPEPASIGTIALLSGAALLRRRRR